QPRDPCGGRCARLEPKGSPRGHPDKEAALLAPEARGGKPVAIVAISVTPIGTGSPSVGEYVADALRVIERSGLRYRLNAMHTEIEGELEQVLDLVPAINGACFARGAKRGSTALKMAAGGDGPLFLGAKGRRGEDGFSR